jgi:hypothetical protein
MTGVRQVTSVGRFSTFLAPSGDWVVVDQDHNDLAVAHCHDAMGAELIAALMNGDLVVLASASADALSCCQRALGGALSVPKPRGIPAVGTPEALPQL